MSLRATLRTSPLTAWAVRLRRRAVQALRFRREFARFQAMADGRFELAWSGRQPCLDDATAGTAFDAHYVFHTAWAARQVAQLRPARHVDISSSLFFCSLVSAFVPVDFYDYRPAALGLSDLRSERADLLALPFADGSVPSLSCMHVVEHIGLGRYGEPLGAQDDLRAMGELARVLAPGGTLLFVTPVGRPRIAYNAHRIYSHAQVVAGFSSLRVEAFALVPDPPHTELIAEATPAMADAQQYGCGCFRFVRPA